MKAYLDSDVLIWHLRGQKKATDFLRKIYQNSEYELYIGAIQRAEIVFFMRPEEEEKTKLLLSLFKTEPVTQSTVDCAARLYRQFKPSHGVDINDCLLAANAIETGGIIFTLNTKHYPMSEVVVKQAWK